MGITISYRGTIASLDRVEDFEDRVLDLALELGGQAHIWRTASDNGPFARSSAASILDLCPGQETTSLLISPEGWLIGTDRTSKTPRRASLRKCLGAA